MELVRADFKLTLFGLLRLAADLKLLGIEEPVKGSYKDMIEA